MTVRFLAVIAAILLCASVPAPAQTYPNRTIKIVAPFPAGAPADSMARLVGQKLSVALGQHVIVDNRGGGNGNVELDLYGGFKGDLPNGFSFDVGVLSYVYPDNNLKPSAATTMPTTLSAIPPTALCSAIARMRRPMCSSSSTRSSDVSRITAPAASAVTSLSCPKAMPTVAAVSAGASLMPSPRNTVRARAVSRRTSSSFCSGLWLK